MTRTRHRHLCRSMRTEEGEPRADACASAGKETRASLIAAKSMDSCVSAASESLRSLHSTAAPIARSARQSMM
jgi:hypothetical protein